LTGTATTRPIRSGSQSARRAAPPPRRRRRVSPGRVVAFVLATAWLVVVIAPIYYMVLASFRSQGNYLTENPWLPSGGLTVSEYGTVFVMVSFVRDIPRELSGAMLVDGGTEWTVFRRLIVPLSAPVLATVAIYDGLDVWNNFLLPLVLTQSNSVAVLPLGLTKLEGQ